MFWAACCFADTSASLASTVAAGAGAELDAPRGCGGAGTSSPHVSSWAVRVPMRPCASARTDSATPRTSSLIPSRPRISSDSWTMS